MSTIRPDNYLGTDRTIWSNFDCVLDEQVEERLKLGDCYAQHAAFNYNGSIWFDPDTETWYEDVWVFGSKVGTITGDSATNVIAKTLAKYGVM
jgi:hypothetical protein